MPQTIMIGANDPNITYLLRRYAEESGFQTTHVHQSDDVPDLAVHLLPNLIILDMELVESTGRQILRRLKLAPTTRNIPIIVYSCLDEPPDDWRESVDGFLLRSVMYDDFVDVLRRAYGSRRA